MRLVKGAGVYSATGDRLGTLNRVILDLREHLGTPYGNVLGYEGRPSETQLARLAALQSELEDLRVRHDAFMEGDVAALK